MPWLLVVVFCDTPVASFFTATETPGTTPPSLSTTVPVSDDAELLPCANAGADTNASTIASSTIHLLLFIQTRSPHQSQTKAVRCRKFERPLSDAAYQSVSI